MLDRVAEWEWTPANLERAKALAAKGLSSHEIALDIGAPSRNAVISKLHRNTDVRTSPSETSDGRKNKRVTFARPAQRVTDPVSIDGYPNAVSLTSKTQSHCNSVIDGVLDRGNMPIYCGSERAMIRYRRKHQLSPYCLQHHLRYHQKPDE